MNSYGTVTLIPELSKDHIFVETFTFNEGNYKNNKINRQINFYILYSN